LLFSL